MKFRVLTRKGKVCRTTQPSVTQGNAEGCVKEDYDFSLNSGLDFRSDLYSPSVS